MKKNILILNGHPAREGLSNFLEREYILGLNLDKIDYKKIKISKLKFDPCYRNYPSQNLEKDLLNVQRLISSADLLVFIYPIWWGSMPAILKGFIDKTFSAGFAYKYSNGIPRGLLKNKKARIIVTAGSPKIFLFAQKILLLTSIKYTILKFCGIKNIKTTVFPGIRKGIPNQKLERISIVCKKAAKKDSFRLLI